MKKGKEIKLDLSSNYSTTISTLNKDDSKTIFLTVSAWGEPKLDKELDYRRVINNLSKSIRQKLYNNLDNKYFDRERTIVDLDMRESGIKFGKKSYTNIDVTLFKTSNLTFKDESLQNYSKELCSVIVDIMESNDKFKFYKKKKVK